MSDHREKIVITGTGIVTGNGGDVASVWTALEKGQTAVRPYEQWDGSDWPVQLGAEVTLDNRTLVPDRKLHKSISRIDMVGIYAGEQAIAQSGLLAHREQLPETEVDPFNDRTGIITGTGGGNYLSNYDYLPLIAEAEGELPAFGQQLANVVTPMWLLRNLPNNVLCHVGIRAQFKGTNTCVTNQCTGGVLAVAECAEAILAGEADRMVAIGHDTPLEPEMVYYYHQLGLMSSATPRPFDSARSGTVFGEGAGALVLERESDAVARGAEILGEYLGFGCCSEATGILPLSEDGDGVRRALTLALENAQLSPQDIGFIVAHGNGTPTSDRTEAKGIQAVFGDNPPPVTSFKWCYGHLIAASGVVDLVMLLEGLKRGVVPGIATLEQLDPELGPLPVSTASQATTSSTGLVICRGFGGMNVVIVLRVV